MATHDSSARKRPVNLSLNEDLVAHARQLTDNRSGVVEQLLTDYVARSGQDREQRARAVHETVEAWNSYATENGSSRTFRSYSILSTSFPCRSTNSGNGSAPSRTLPT